MTVHCVYLIYVIIPSQLRFIQESCHEIFENFPRFSTYSFYFYMTDNHTYYYYYSITITHHSRKPLRNIWKPYTFISIGFIFMWLTITSITIIILKQLFSIKESCYEIHEIFRRFYFYVTITPITWSQIQKSNYYL